MIDRPAPRPQDAQLQRLLAKYDRPGPRYTSYPTAPAWSDDFGPDDQIDRLRQLRERTPRKPLSLYVHIPFCHHRCLYCGCNVVISPKDKVSAPYLQALRREIEMYRAELGDGWEVLQLHLGGGTPTYLQPAQFDELWDMLQAFPLAEGAEVSIEVDPVVTTLEHVAKLRALGFNRLSMGVQDLDPKVQETVQRVQPLELTQRFYQACRDAEFDSVNMDLIYGLPFQSEESFAKTVDQIVAWGPDRVAVFNYAHVPWIKPHQNRMPADALPPPDTKYAIFQDTSRRFEAAGYAAIGLDHFALPDDELSLSRRDEKLRRNFMGYTTLPETDILAFGVSSISEVAGSYGQNHTRLSHYQKAIEAGHLPIHRGVRLTKDDLVRRDVIMDIMCNFVLHTGRIEQRHGIDFTEYFADREPDLVELEADGLIARRPGRLEVTPLGQTLVRNVAMVFDAYLKGPEEGRPLYSRTV